MPCIRLPCNRCPARGHLARCRIRDCRCRYACQFSFARHMHECGGMSRAQVCKSGWVKDGEAAGVPGAKVSQAPPSQTHFRAAGEEPRKIAKRCRKVLRSLRRPDLGAIRRICFRSHVCGSNEKFSRPEMGIADRDEADGCSGGIVLHRKTDRSEIRRARPGQRSPTQREDWAARATSRDCASGQRPEIARRQMGSFARDCEIPHQG